MTPRPAHPLVLGFVGLGLAGSLAGCTAASADPSSAPSSGDNAAEAAVSGPYTDGTYTEDGSYVSPAGQETVTVKLTLTDDKVTAVTVTPHATNPTAKQFQAIFAQGISSVVVGKDIDALDVSRVAGSSLTSGGFNAALAAIKADAKS